MSNGKTVVADAVQSAFSLSAEMLEQIAIAAEMATDASFDFSKACDSVAGLFGALKAEGVLTFTSWNLVADKFKAVATVRARDNGVIDPEGAANDCWERVAKRNRDIHGLTKPKSEEKGALAMTKKREEDKAKALVASGGRSSQELKADVLALYGQATEESIAKADALKKVVKVVESVEKEAVSTQMKPLINAANDQHKKVMEFLKGKNDPNTLGDYVVLLKRTLEIWETGK
jgi:hypothetical protein